MRCDEERSDAFVARAWFLINPCKSVHPRGIHTTHVGTLMIDIGWHHTQFEANSLVYDFPVRGTSSVTAEAVHSWHQVESTASERSHRRSSLLHLRLCCCRIPRARAGSWVAADAAEVAKLSDNASDSGRKLRCGLVQYCCCCAVFTLHAPGSLVQNQRCELASTGSFQPSVDG